MMSERVNIAPEIEVNHVDCTIGSGMYVANEAAGVALGRDDAV